jgi:hypothetical protein
MTLPGRLFAAVVAVRIFTPNALLDQFYNYDLRESGGSIVLKIHPGTYLLAICAFLFAGMYVRDMKSYVASLQVGGVALIAAIWCLMWGHSLSIGYLIDALFTAGLALFCYSRLQEEDHEGVFRLILSGVFVNAAIAMVEFALKWRLIPYAYREPTFRPAALFSHPLTSALVMATTVPVVMNLRRPLLLRAVLACFLMVAILATGARAATIGSLIAFTLSYLVVAKAAVGKSDPRHAIMAGLQAMMTTVMVPLVVVLAFLSGLGYRFASALMDDSGRTRLDAFTLLRYLDERTFWTGAGAETLLKNTRFLLGGRMESAIVVAVYQFGIPVALLFAGGCLLALRSVITRTSAVLTISALTFVGVGLSNDALVGKTSLWTFALVFLAAAGSIVSRRPDPSPEPAPCGEQGRGGAWSGKVVTDPPLGWGGPRR